MVLVCPRRGVDTGWGRVRACAGCWPQDGNFSPLPKFLTLGKLPVMCRRHLEFLVFPLRRFLVGNARLMHSARQIKAPDDRSHRGLEVSRRSSGYGAEGNGLGALVFISLVMVVILARGPQVTFPFTTPVTGCHYQPVVPVIVHGCPTVAPAGWVKVALQDGWIVR